MKTCPKCGAENRDTATECRLCATLFEAAVPTAVALDPPRKQSEPLAPATVCPACQAVNESGWAFCMQCGKKLPPAAKLAYPAGQAGAASKTPEPTAKPAAAGGIVCPQCGDLNSDTGFYCASCGALLTAPGGRGPAPTRKAVVQLITEGGQVGEVHSVDKSQMTIGRVDGDLVFPHDGYMSGKHAVIVERDGRFYLSDQKSRNGTFVRIKTEVELNPGDMFLVGKQLFRFEK